MIEANRENTHKWKKTTIFLNSENDGMVSFKNVSNIPIDTSEPWDDIDKLHEDVPNDESWVCDLPHTKDLPNNESLAGIYVFISGPCSASPSELA